MEEELEDIEEAVVAVEVMEGVLAHIKMVLRYHISPGTLNINSGIYSQKNR